MRQPCARQLNRYSRSTIASIPTATTPFSRPHQTTTFQCMQAPTPPSPYMEREAGWVWFARAIQRLTKRARSPQAIQWGADWARSVGSLRSLAWVGSPPPPHPPKAFSTAKNDTARATILGRLMRRVGCASGKVGNRFPDSVTPFRASVGGVGPSRRTRSLHKPRDPDNRANRNTPKGIRISAKNTAKFSNI